MKVRDNKGSITVFVLVGLLFMTGFLIISFGSNLNKSKNAKEQLNILSGIYSQGDTDLEAYERAYTAIRKKNAQLLTQTIENSSSLELTKTFTDTLSDYKIYGNSVQDGTATPEAPIEIESVGDKTRNLAKITNTDNLSFGGANASVKNGIVYVDGTTISNGNVYFESFRVSKNSDYTISLDISGYTTKASSNASMLLQVSDDNVNFSNIVELNFSKTGARKKVVSLEKTKYYRIRFYLYAECTFTNAFIKVQLEEGSTATEYEPYGYKIPVRVSGKNLFNGYDYINRNSNASITDNILTLYDNSNGQKNPLYENTTNISQVTFFLRIKRTTNYLNLIFEYTDGTKEINMIPANNDFVDYTFTSNVNKVIKNIYCNYNHGLPLEIDLSVSQIEKGTIATEYEPYVEPITTNIYLDEPLRKIGGYKDYIDFENGKVVRKIRELVLDGVTINKKINYVTLHSSGLYYAVLQGLSGINGFADVLMNTHFTPASGVVIGHCYITGNGESQVMVHSNRELNTLNLWNEWLQEQYNNGTPVKFQYALATIDDTEPIDLPEFLTFEDYTKIEVLTEVAPSKIEATYYGYTME